MIKFLALGGADDIGASCYYLYIDGTGILIDCGIHPRKTGTDAIPDFSPLEYLPLDSVIITHAHQDHIGALPFLVKKFPHVKIYSTVQTREVARLTLNNAVNIIKKQIEPDSKVKPYSYEEVDLLVRSVREYKYGENFTLKGLLHESNKEIICSLHDAGHILGSSSVLINYGEESLFFTGDINLSAQAIMNGAELPESNVRTIITESTYGSTESRMLKNWQEESNRFADFINKIINSGGSVLVPVFSLGKTQELLAVTAGLMAKNRLVEVPVYSAGLGRKISELYDKNRYLVNRIDPEFELKNFPQNEIVLPKFFDEIKKNPGIVFSSSGMILENTVSFDLAKFWIRQKGYGIALVGYMDPLSPGYLISRANPGEKIKLADTQEEVLNQSVVKKFHFASHSRREELLEIIGKLSPQRVVIIHGEGDSRNWLGYNILTEHPGVKVYTPEIQKEIILS